MSKRRQYPYHNLRIKSHKFSKRSTFGKRGYCQVSEISSIILILSEDTCFVVLEELKEEFEKGEASELTHEHKKTIFTTLL